MASDTIATMNETRLPRAVRAQMERVRGMTEPQQTGTDNASDPTAAPAPQDAPPPGTPPAPAPSEPSQKPATQGGSSSELQPFHDPNLANDPRALDPMYWRQRLGVTQGFLQRDRAQFEQRIAEMNRQIDELQEQVRTQQKSAPPPPMDVSALFTPDQIERFGQEQCEAMATAAQTAARQHVAAMVEAEVKPIRERQTSTAKTEAQRKQRDFEDRLAEIVPDYKEIDAGEDWRAWLGQEDESTGIERQQILNTYCGRLDVAKVARMFEQFKSGKAAAAAQRAQPQVVPSRAAGAPAAAPAVPAPAQGAPTKEEMRAFYKRAALGKVKDPERVAFEARLSLAQAAA